MSDIENIISKLERDLRKRLSEAYDQGYRDGEIAAKNQIMSLLSVDGRFEAHTTPHLDKAKQQSADSHPDIEHRKRAPRGLPKALTIRALKQNDLLGSTPQDIMEQAETEYEKMIALSSIRSELRKGEKDGRYHEQGGLWYLADGYDNDGKGY